MTCFGFSLLFFDMIATPNTIVVRKTLLDFVGTEEAVLCCVVVGARRSPIQIPSQFLASWFSLTSHHNISSENRTMKQKGTFVVLALFVNAANAFAGLPLSSIGLLNTRHHTRRDPSVSSYADPAKIHQQTQQSSTLLRASSAPNEQQVIDWSAIGKYIVAIGVQMGLISSLLAGLDRLSLQVSFGLNFVLFYLLSLKSRIFNPLSNQRPQPKTLETSATDMTNERKMPSWTPPGVIFPIMWLLIIAPIRSFSSCMVYQSVGSGCYLSRPILFLMLHLSIGDVWNTINNVERRYGASVSGVAAVWLSKAYAAYQYGIVQPTAGKLLALPLIWLTVASALITSTWRINPDPTSGLCDSLIPRKKRGEPSRTSFAWFS